jgi:hemerythrin-like metal-binding protein
VLKELVTETLRNIRSADMLFRWGGEEFVVLAVSTGYQSAAALAEHLRKQVADHRFGIVGSLTASFGVAEHTTGESVEHWLSRVDAALYTAKTGGRNLVTTDRRGESDTWQSGAGLSVLRLVWHDNYNSGHPQIDDEHRELFALCNNLIAAFGHDGEQQAALDQLLDHIALHFKHEERILEENNYDRFTEHQAAHKALLRKAADLKRASDNGSIRFSHLINFLVNDVVARHLFTADHDYFSLFSDVTATAGQKVVD